ncbi:MAG TPA: DUF1800 domain-containing protein [Terracidiphilus sp.]
MQARHESPSVFRQLLILLTSFGAAVLITSCSSITVGNGSSFTAISASVSTLRVNQTTQLATHTQFDGTGLTFFVNGIPGGNSQVGTISSSGLYTAPAIVPTPNSVTITSASAAHPNFPPGSAPMAIWNPIPVLNTIDPSGFSEGTTQINVAGSHFVYGAQVMWNGKAVETTYVSNTQLIAVIPAPNQGTYPLLVRNPDPGSANSTTLSVRVKPGQPKLMIQPYNSTDVRVNNMLNLPLTVTGTINTGVTLQVNGVAGGNLVVGTAVSNSDGSISYHAPAVVPTPNNVVQLTVTSVDDPTISINQNISVLNPIPILTSASPMTMNPGPPATTVVLTGQSFINGAQVLMNGAAVPTTFNSGTQLTANVSPTEPGNLDLQVLNPSPGPATSADLVATVNGTPPVPIISPEDASRFLDQATFGASDADIHHLSLIGYQSWLNEQFVLPQTTMEPGVEQALIVNAQPPCASADVKCNGALFEQNNQAQEYVENAFWQQSLGAPDQLRQRVAYSLHEMLVISMASTDVQNMPRGAAHYYDMLGADAFGNFRQLLEDVTLNPMMGNWLAMLGNDKGNANTDPDENYAREVMQLFTIGLYQLNDDGSQKLDGSGQPIPTYSNVDVQGLAKVFTGFSWNVPGDTSDNAWSNCCIYAGPGHGEDLLQMQSYPTHHSTVEKDFLGVTIAPGSSNPTGDLKIALDTLFNHPNLPAFFSKQMIQHLVTSSPSPAYVSRVAAVFKDNGQGVRGDLKAVVTAILMDPEARDTATDVSNPKFGKVREALLRYTHWARAFTAQSRTGGYWLGSTEDPIWGLGQMTLRSPTVFNWFAPGYVPPGTSIEQAGMVAPEMQMTNVSSVVGYLNFLQTAVGSDATNGFDVFSSYSAEMNLAANPGALVDRVNLLLMAGEMDSNLYSQILSAVSAIPIPSGDQNAINSALGARVRTAIFLTMASPSYCAQF